MRYWCKTLRDPGKVSTPKRPRGPWGTGRRGGNVCNPEQSVRETCVPVLQRGTEGCSASPSLGGLWGKHPPAHGNPLPWHPITYGIPLPMETPYPWHSLTHGTPLPMAFPYPWHSPARCTPLLIPSPHPWYPPPIHAPQSASSSPLTPLFLKPSTSEQSLTHALLSRQRSSLHFAWGVCSPRGSFAPELTSCRAARGTWEAQQPNCCTIC